MMSAFLEVTDSSFSPDVIGFSREFAVEICFTSYSFYLVGVASVADRFLRFVVFRLQNRYASGLSGSDDSFPAST